MDGVARVMIGAVHSVAILFQHQCHITLLPATAHAYTRGHVLHFTQICEDAGFVATLQRVVQIYIAVLAHHFGICGRKIAQSYL